MRRFKFRGSASQELEQSSQTEAKRRAMSAILFLAFVFLLVSPLGARAGMIGAYDPSLWTLTNTSADGFVTVTAAGVDITGGNTGTGNPGTTDFQIVAVGTGLVSFSFEYFSLDSPTFDYAGYLLGPNFFPLADSSGISGSQSFAVTLGENFGFRVGTADNQFEPGILSISDFNAPVSTISTGAPEPATGAIVLAALAFVLGIKLRQRRTHQGLTAANRIRYSLAGSNWARSAGRLFAVCADSFQWLARDRPIGLDQPSQRQPAGTAGPAVPAISESAAFRPQRSWGRR